MKEFQSQEGGRHVYNSDFKNLQELALATQEIFRACGGNFVISGCDVTESNSQISVSSGYVYIDGKVRAVAAASGLSSSNLYIVAAQTNGETIPYADGGSASQYTDYYAEAANLQSVNAAYISYDSSSKSFPNLATYWFNYYAVAKKAGTQTLDTLIVSNRLTTASELFASNGVQIGASTTKVTRVGSNLQLTVGDFTYTFSSNGIITVAKNGSTLFSFSNGSGSGTVTYANVTVSGNLNTKKLYIDGVDISNVLSPLGIVQMWAGPVANIPSNYKLCNGDALSTSDYAELYKVIGDTFNTANSYNGSIQSSPGTGKFRLPDLRGRFIVGYNNAISDYSKLGTTGGEAKHYLTQNEMPAHTHSFDDYYYIENSASLQSSSIYGRKLSLATKYIGSSGTDSDNNSMLYYTHNTYNTGSGNAHENRPPYYVLAYIMRVK